MVGIVNGTEHQIHLGIEQAFIVPRGDLKGVGRLHICLHGIQRRVRIVTHPFDAMRQSVKKLRDPALEAVTVGEEGCLSIAVLLRDGSNVWGGDVGTGYKGRSGTDSALRGMWHGEGKRTKVASVAGSASRQQFFGSPKGVGQMGLQFGDLFQHGMVKIKLAGHAIHHLANLDEADQKRWRVGFGHGCGKNEKKWVKATKTPASRWQAERLPKTRAEDWEAGKSPS